jgi:putative peptidoglycan lipid II flippase
MIMATVSILANIGLGIVLMKPLAHAGLALATSLASILNLALLVLALRKKLGALGWRGIAHSALKTMGSAVVMSAVVWVAAKILIPAQGASFLALVAGVMACVAAGLAIFWGCSYGVRSPELGTMLAEIKKSINRK